MRAPGLVKATPFRSLVAALSVILFSVTSPTSAWSLHSSLSNASAVYFEENHSFRVYLMPEEILDYVILPGFDCSISDRQAYIKNLTKSNGAPGTLLQWNEKAPPEKKEFTLELHCLKIHTLDDENSNKQSSTSPRRRKRALRVARQVDGTASTPRSDLPEEPNIPTESTSEAKEESSPPETPQQTAVTAAPPIVLTSPSGGSSPPMLQVNDGAPATTSPSEAQSAMTQLPIEVTSLSPSTPKTTAATTTTTGSPPASPNEASHSTESITNSETIAGNIANDSVAGRQASGGGEPTLSTSTSDPSNSEQGFSLVITRVSVDFVHAQKLSSLDDVLNITRELEAAMFNRTTFAMAALKDSTSSQDEKQSSCLLLPKEVRVIENQYVLFSLGLNSTNGELIRGGHMSRSCGYEDWRPGKDFLAEASHVRFLDAKLFQLQVLSICLAAAVIVFALSAVFLCTKWRLAVRGSRREAHDEFYIKTFYTKEHQYAANGDDFYGFPTIRRDSTFYRNPSNVNATPNTIDGSSFVNGAFQDGEEHQNLPAPPPELRTCIINDANFTDVPLHNLGSDSLRAHRGAHRHQSPPPPPLRTVSSGYMSGQSTPAVEYHNPQEVMNLPPIPKEDYSDSDSESGQASLKTDGNRERAVERKGRFTVRTAL